MISISDDPLSEIQATPRNMAQSRFDLLNISQPSAHKYAPSILATLAPPKIREAVPEPVSLDNDLDVSDDSEGDQEKPVKNATVEVWVDQ